MKSNRTLAIALVILGFMATLAILWPRGAPSPKTESPANRSAAKSWLGGWSMPKAWSDLPFAAKPPAARAAPRTAAPAEDEVPPADYAGPALPVLFAISSYPGRPRVVETDDDTQAATVAPDQPDLVRQVDIFNTSGDLLQITVLALDMPTGQTTHAFRLVPPHAQAHVGSEAGLKLDPGNQVTLRARGYQDLTETVH
jgi:hypothetical protein